MNVASENPYLPPSEYASSIEMPVINPSVVRFAGIGLVVSFAWQLLLMGLRQPSVLLEMDAWTGGLIASAIGSALGTIVFALVKWLLPRIAVTNSIALSAFVFFTTLTVVGYIRFWIGIVGPVGWLTLPIALITTIAFERLAGHHPPISNVPAEP